MAWFVKLEEGLVPKPRFDAVVPAHLAWLAELEGAGHRPISGYWADRKGRSGDGAGGMLLFWASDWQQAMELVQQDPLILQGCVRWTLHQWQPVFGASELRSETAAPAPSSADGIPAPRGSDPAPPAALP
ncbi:YciI family protein [Synechococcus sp. GFB01]|uniref:YciI family protein n=1 Tax=Synechococcus sp. GFB01 TaxID=1662190 RepID=UPI0009E77DB6|nr:YciI family protein [Synechococcus sp. GFB01]